ncbi:SpoIIE family protein phosphatase [Streptomyces zhihengii]|uniref:SpoIIE family protein phosphatase n=1 Tax=Streptomyces zhihengii TaxID=1818004 RepID=UPI0036B0A235
MSWWQRTRAALDARSVAGQVLFLQVVVAVLLITAALVVLVIQARNESEQAAQERSLAAAASFAHSPGIVAALRSGDPGDALQPLMAEAGEEAGVDFINVMATDGTRLADTDPRLVGEVNDGVERALREGAFTEIFKGAPTDAARAIAPVTGADGAVIGLVGAGVQIGTVGDEVDRQLPVFLTSAGAALALATVSAALVSRRLRRQTHGIGPSEMTRMYEHHDAVLHAVREGVLIVGDDNRLVLANDEARRLLEITREADGRPVTELGLDEGIAALLVSGRSVTDEVHLAGDRLLAVNTRPTAPYGGSSGCVATLRDTTELRSLAGTAEVARERLKILYEAGVRIGTTLDVVRTAEELSGVAVPRFADFVTVELPDAVLSGDDPPDPPTTMRRAALSGVDPDHPFQPVGDPVRFVAHATPMARAMAGGHAVLEADLGSAEAWRAQDPQGAAGALAYGVHSLVTVPLQASGVVLGMVSFWRAQRAEPFGEEDLSFAEELAARAAVAIDNARRFTREHTMAETLQRSLLPHVLPSQPALDTAYRYLPAQARVGGDWFDIIPLPGLRVALVVGDVVGHGLHAAATMGRLRTGVHNFSTLDLPPDELLTRLDDLVGHLDREERRAGEGTTGATCLYAVYDPVSGRCTLASAGHLAPALVHPDGTVEFVGVPVSPPLGVGSLPVESTELVLPEGSRLVLYTDGLVEDRVRDIDVGLEELRSVLAAHAHGTVEEICEGVFAGMVPARRRDDIALLVARTRRLDPSLVASWEVPQEPSAVGPVRAACSRRLAEWGLEDIAFTTELVLSELITNAVRYGSGPIGVRLLHDPGRTLVCEVSDGSSTSPHLRRATATDEGGRGLFLVAQLASRWGTRYLPAGKVIWAEQSLAEGGQPPGEALFEGIGNW